jgi:ABC-type branched-subunit amino acid transport system substrate-binding protein
VTPDPRAKRAEYLRAAKGPIVVGLVYDHGGASSFGEAARIVLDAVQVAGRTIELRDLDDRADIVVARRHAQALVDDPGVVAVLGHASAATARGTALQYEFGGVNLLTPAEGPASLGRDGLRFVVRLRPPSEAYGRAAAEWAAQKGIRSVCLLAGTDDPARAASAAFEQRADDLHVRLGKRAPIDAAGESSVPTAEGGSEAVPCEAWVVASGGQPSNGALGAITRAGWPGPVLLLQPPVGAVPPESLARAFLMVVAASAPRERVERFREAWRARHGEAPDALAIAGADGAWALAEALRQSTEPTPAAVSTAIRGTRSEGAGGSAWFDERGGRSRSALRVARWSGTSWIDE